MIVVVGFAVEVGDGAQGKEHEPADVQRVKILHGFAQQQQDQVGHNGHNQACGSHKLVGVHLAGVVNFG